MCPDIFSYRRSRISLAGFFLLVDEAVPYLIKKHPAPCAPDVFFALFVFKRVAFERLIRNFDRICRTAFKRVHHVFF